MGHKLVCLECRKAYSVRPSSLDQVSWQCPEFGHTMLAYNEKFRPPRHNDRKAWEVVAFLAHHGFFYQTIAFEHKQFSEIYGKLPSKAFVATYPETMTDAREFVTRYSAWSRKRTME